MKNYSVMRWTFNLLSLAPIFIFLNSEAAVPAKTAMFPEGERLVYTRLIEAYRRNSLPDVIRQRQILERNYPKSVHLDNAYYLDGMVELQHGRMAEAIKAFDVIKDQFIKSNKRPGALFAIGVTYQRLNLAPQAHHIFSQLMSDYPGSPESQRAWMQLRVEKETAKSPLKR